MLVDLLGILIYNIPYKEWWYEKISRIQNDATYVGQQILFAMHLFSRFALAFIITAALLFYNLAVTGILVISLTLSYLIIFILCKQANSHISSDLHVGLSHDKTGFP